MSEYIWNGGASLGKMSLLKGEDLSWDSWRNRTPGQSSGKSSCIPQPGLKKQTFSQISHFKWTPTHVENIASCWSGSRGCQGARALGAGVVVEFLRPFCSLEKWVWPTLEAARWGWAVSRPAPGFRGEQGPTSHCRHSRRGWALVGNSG